MLTRFGAGEKQVGHVGAGDQPDQADDHEERPELLPRRFVCEQGAYRTQPHTPAFVHFCVVRSVTSRQRIEKSPGLQRGGPDPEAEKDRIVPETRIRGAIAICPRNPVIDFLLWKDKVIRHDTDNGVLLIGRLGFRFKFDRFPNDLRVATQARAPEGLA